MILLPDIVLDTCALKVLLDNGTTDKMVANHDHVFVEQCTWRKELMGVHTTHLINLFHESVRKLRNNFHEATTVRNALPPRLLKEVTRNGGDSCDVRIANLACERAERSGHSAFLVSNDHCFQNSKPMFIRQGVEIRYLCEFETEYQ